jgi:hypothetical protein
VRIGEERAACREFVEVGSLRLWRSAHAPDPVVLVVDGKHEDVGLGGFYGQSRSDEQGEGKRGDGFHACGDAE